MHIHEMKSQTGFQRLSRIYFHPLKGAGSPLSCFSRVEEVLIYLKVRSQR